jgi:trimethylamine--corrinoid protein Co-methyltransferase
VKDIHATPSVRFLADADIKMILEDAGRLLSEVGVQVEHTRAVDTLAGAGAEVGNDNRVRIGSDVIQRTLDSISNGLDLYDREGAKAIALGAGTTHFAPGSAAIRVHDYTDGCTRPSTLEDCARFAQLTDALPALALQSTCIVPFDVPVERADAQRLFHALQNSCKPIVTGTTSATSFDTMLRMLTCVRGGSVALREKPLAIFDCCPTSPLCWSELTCATLVNCAESGIPAELISVPMTGATAPVTLRGAVTQHAAENLSGLAIHQLTCPGAPLVWGACASAFDMREGTSPLGAIESMMMNAACAEVGRHIGLPTHAYLALSDSKTLDYQAGLESGVGALLAALSGIDVVSGPGMLEFVRCQSLEKLVLDHEACRMAFREPP